MKNKLMIYTAVGLLLTGAGAIAFQNQSRAVPDYAAASDLAGIESASGDAVEQPRPVGNTRAGAYLSSHYAQKQNDWKKATVLLDQILDSEPENVDLIRQAMVLAAGSGQSHVAVTHAKKLLTLEPDNALAYLIITTDSLAKGQYRESLQYISGMPKGDMTDFVVPLLEGWAHAGLNEYKTDNLRSTTIHAWHAGLIALYLKRKPAEIALFAEIILAPSGLTSEEVERAADLMALAGHHQDALNIYKALQSQKGASEDLLQKVDLVKNKGDIKTLVPAFRITNPSQGAALSLYDLARILYQEKSDVSARVFAEMALQLDPDLAQGRILIASSYARTGQIEEALAQYKAVPQDNPEYLEVQHASAELLQESGNFAEAVALLTDLYNRLGNPESMIRVGDLYRSEEDFKKALDVYNSVVSGMPSPLPDNQWGLLYARGMTYERLGDWDKAEADLKEALKRKPDHPYIMNYLGYGWADKGRNLEEAIKMLEQASALRPADGYITDSLGWVYYMSGKYKESVPHLEAAVQMLPYDPVINDHLGDAYWRVGRKVEARFQWDRSRNYSKDQALIDRIDIKLAKGLEPAERPQITASQPDPIIINR